jgi:hypothetical protein
LPSGGSGSGSGGDTPPHGMNPTIEDTTVDLGALLRRANEALDRGNPSLALTLAVRAIQRDEHATAAYAIAVAAACHTGDADAAKRYFARVPDEARDALVRDCHAAGVELP